MKHVKMIGLAAMTAMALMAFIGASAASATELYSGATTLGVGTEINASLSGTASLTTTEGTVLDTCTGGEVKGKTTTAGGAAATVKGDLSALTWTNCTEPTVTLALGGLEVHHTSGVNGTVTSTTSSKGVTSEVTINTTIFGSCVFTIASGATIGTLTGTTAAGSQATFDINAVATRKSGLCPASAKWVGTYKVTKPVPLHVTAS